MRKLVTSEQALQLDTRTQTIDRLSAEVLMNRAGQKAARQLRFDYPQAQSILLLIGPGNNGGDGLVTAKEFCCYGPVTIICPQEGHSELWHKKKTELFKVSEQSSFELEWVSAETLTEFMDSHAEQRWPLGIDAAFGVGLARPLSNLWMSVLKFVRERSDALVAVDIPSGLNGSSGLAFPGTVRVDRTYTMGFAKLGLLIGDGPSLSGKIKVLKIGFSKSAEAELQPVIHFCGEPEAVALLPSPSSWKSNKSDRGQLLVIAGSAGMDGAGALASMAGARMGAGYVTWARWPHSESSADLGALLAKAPHLLTARLDGELNFLATIKAPRAVVIGPGLGINESSRQLLRAVYQRFRDLPVVVDADALHLLKLENLYPVPAAWILTPHTGELAKLLGESIDSINADRLQAVVKAQQHLGGTVLLKGYRSLVMTPKGEVVVIGSGGPVLGKAGSGDVLAGMIGGALAMGLPSREAVILSAYLHGRAGDLFARRWKNDFTMVATDLPEAIPYVLKGLYAKLSSQSPRDSHS